MENPSGDELMFDYSDLGFDYPILNMPDNIQMSPRSPTNHHQLQTPTSTLPNEVGSTPQAQIQSGVNMSRPNQAEARFQNVFYDHPNIHMPANQGMGSFNQNLSTHYQSVPILNIVGNTNGGLSTIGNPQASRVSSQNMPSYRPPNYLIRPTQDMRPLNQGLPIHMYQRIFSQNTEQYEVGESSMANQQRQAPLPLYLHYKPVQYITTNTNLQYQDPFTQNSRGNPMAWQSNAQNNNIPQMPSSQFRPQRLVSLRLGQDIITPLGSHHTNPMIPQVGGSSRPQQFIPQGQGYQPHQPKTHPMLPSSRSQSLPKGRAPQHRSSKVAESSRPSLIRSSCDLIEQSVSLTLNHDRPVRLAPDSYVLSRSPPYSVESKQPSTSHRGKFKKHHDDPPALGTLPPQQITSGDVPNNSPEPSKENNQQNQNTPVREPSKYISLRDIGQFQDSNSPTSEPNILITLPPPQFDWQKIGDNNVGEIGSSQQLGLGDLFLSPNNSKGKLPMFRPVSMSPRHVYNMLETKPNKADHEAAPSSRGLENSVYNPSYERSTLPIDPHLRSYAINDFTEESMPERANKRRRMDDGPSGVLKDNDK